MSLEGKKILIIGGNAFSAQSFINLASCKNEVIVTSRSEARKDFGTLYPSFIKNKVKFIKCDYRDTESMVDCIDQYKPSYIVNYAAQSEVAPSWEDPFHWFDTNVTAFNNLINKIKDFDFIEKFIHSSTPEVYGSTTVNATENENYNPSTPYASSKSCADIILSSYGESHNFPFIRTRVGNIYGPGQQLYKIIPKSIYCMYHGKKISLHGGGKSERAFIHSADVADAMLTLLEKGQIKETYHISYESQRKSIFSLVYLIAAKMGVDIDDVVTFSEDRKGKDALYSLNSFKMKALEWSPVINISSGITNLIANMTPGLKTEPFDQSKLFYHHVE